jgi:DNA-binding MarR family transcriptional regulator
MSGRPTDKKALASRAWNGLFELFMTTRPQRDAVLERFGLTANDVRALNTLDSKIGKPMRTLADAWNSDASNATWLVDRLERLGLAERRSLDGDRRVKLVVLTRRGARTRDAILEAFHQPPPELFKLDRLDLHLLGEVLEKVNASSPAAR